MQENYPIVIGILIATAFVSLFAFMLLLLILHYSRKKQRLIYERRLMEEKYRRELEQVEREVQEHTFQMIAQDIHDNVGQQLSLVKLNLSILSMENKQLQSLHDIRDQVAEAIQQLRQISMGYQGDRLLESGLPAGISLLVEQLQKTGKFLIRFDYAGCQMDIHPNHGLFIYRIFQEIIQNIIRHSGATAIDIELTESPEAYRLRVNDNGIGFDRDEIKSRNGLGLRSIHQRASLIGADVQMHSARGRGTTIILTYKKISDDNNGIGR
ncbi:MAG: sensor histidine kinase [Bacteroidota bacterium]|jgi:signal transduction histidine kinase